MLMHPLSVVIITFNEERNIRRCLESVKDIADEIVVIDSFSTDATEKICSEFNAKFHRHAFDGYIEQKNRALEYAAFPYVLSLDADEGLDETLQQTVREAKKNFSFDAYSMNRLNNYCGKWIYHTGWYPDKKIRLFNKTKGKWTGMNPHDRFELSTRGRVTHLAGNILHYSYYSTEEHYRQAENFSSISASEHFKKGRRSFAIMPYVSAAIKFVKMFLFQKGFLDGKEGFQIARISAFTDYLKHKKILQLQRNANENK